jgi:L-alanine-DL-glutamate epimerase-like enolase superfamily enzyme
MESDIRLVEFEPFFYDTECRTPLKFGAVVVDKLPYCEVKATVENAAGQTAEGWGGMFVMDMWGWPSPNVDHDVRLTAMKELIRRNCRMRVQHGRTGHPIDLYVDTEPQLETLSRQVCEEMNLAEVMPFLNALVCASSADAAVHDAFGMVNGISTYDGYGKDFCTHDLSAYLGDAFAGKYVADYIRADYVPEIPVFHLVGGLDKLRRSELDGSDPDDGLPNTLDDWIERDGLFCLKVKLKGTDLDWDLQRTLDVVAIAHEAPATQAHDRLYFTADTNEQCEHPDYIVEFLNRLREQSQQAFDELLYVEQPTERDLHANKWRLDDVAKLKPVIIDESLTSMADFDLALELGWTGVALKACKSQSMALLMACRAAELGIAYTVQDLTNPALALLQSVGLAARLSPLKGVEANSHQFFPEASHREAPVHPGLCRRRDGILRTESLQGPGLGYQIDRLGARV